MKIDFPCVPMPKGREQFTDACAIGRQLMAELDAAYFILYGIECDDVLYILSTFQGLAKEGQDLFDNETAKLILTCYDEYTKGCKG